MYQKVHRILLALLMSFAFSLSAGADEITAGFGAGVNHSSGGYLGSLAYAWDLPEEYNPGNLFFLEGRAAVYTTPTVFAGTLGIGAMYEPVRLLHSGTEREKASLYVRGTAGVTLQSRVTSRLGGHFQFMLKAGTGIKVGGMRIGPTYTHYSSAGIYDKNAGEDFLGVEIGFDL